MSNETTLAQRSNRARLLPRTVWALGLTSLFMDASSELIHSLLPLYMTIVLGASTLSIGLIEGIAEATAAVMKLVSGVVSDYVGKRKGLVVLGYGLAALSKPLFPLATTIHAVLLGRFIDRVGKGIRGAPRDAMIADVTHESLRGAAFGLRQALDSVGAFIGPLLGILLMLWLANDLRTVLWVAIVPAVVAVLVLIVATDEPATHASPARERARLSLADATRLPRRYWLVVTLGAVFMLARFSEAFLVLRAQDVGLPLALAPAVMIVMNVVYAAIAYPAGVLADRIDKRTLLTIGLIVLVLADAVLALASSALMIGVGATLWGLHMGFTQGLMLKLVADTAPTHLRATAFGLFNLTSAGALLIASVVAGWLWHVSGPAATFACGGVFAAIALLGMFIYRTLPGTRRR